MKRILLPCVLILLFTSGGAISSDSDCQDDLYVEISDDIARPKLRYPQKEQLKMKKLNCVDCKNEFAYKDEIAFKIDYEGDDNLCVYLGLKIYEEKAWKVYDYNYLGFDEGTLLFIPRHSKGAVHKWARKEHSSIKNGARFMLYAWKLYPDTRGLTRDIHEFTIKPKLAN